MKLVRFGCRSINTSISHPLCRSTITRYLSATSNPFSGNDAQNTQNSSTSESADEFERRIFGGISGSSSNSDSFFRKLDRLEKGRSGPDWSRNLSGGNGLSSMDGLDESFNSLSDGMDGKLEKAATYFEFDPEEIMNEDYSFRPDVRFKPYTTYEIKDLDLRKPGVSKPGKRYEFKVTTEEVLRKADFRNVSFLANFITEAGIIIKRSKTGISAKAQRKVAREIKTARAFGLMPFTTMGTKSFVFGKTMEALDEDYAYETYESHFTADADGKDSFVA